MFSPVVALWSLAQSAAPTNNDIATLVTLVAQIGLSAIFLWQWWDERRERRNLTKTLIDWIERYGPALEVSTATLAHVQRSMEAQVERNAFHAPTPADRELVDSVSTLKDMLADLSRVMKPRGRDGN